MKRIIALLISVVFVVMMAGCGSKTSNNETQTNKESVSETQSTEETAEWKQFVKDYEAFVDSYIEVMKKYKENPSDLSLVSEYSKMVTEASECAERGEKITDELGDSEEALEFAAEMLRIAGKMTDLLTDEAN